MRGIRRIGVALCVATCIVAGCTSGPTNRSATDDPSTVAPVTTASTLPAEFTGDLDAFYTPPPELAPAPPGTLIRYQRIAETDDAVTWRILYHSVDAAGRDQPVPGTVTFPTADAPAQGWPVVSTAPGTVGLNTSCALSRAGVAPQTFGTPGVAVRTDYIGMVHGQVQRYLSGASEAHSVIDAVRAARNIPAAHAGTRWVVSGQSQGGHASLFTNELAAGYAPELDLLGAVVGAPAAQLTELYGPNDVIVPHIVELMGLFGIGADHPDTDPEAYLTEEARAKASVVTDGCLDDIIGAFAGLATDGLYAKDPLTVEPAASLVMDNDPGQVASDSPILLYQGTRDWYVVPARTDALRRRLCAVGQVTWFETIEGADHGTDTAMAHELIAGWIADRFAGDPAPDNCPGD